MDPTDRRAKQQHGLCRAVIANMVTGVHEGFDRHLELQGVGYRAALNNDKLSLNIGLRYVCCCVHGAWLFMKQGAGERGSLSFSGM